LLYEAAELLGNKELTATVKQIAIDIARQNFTGLDKDNGLLYEYFPSEDRFDTDKHWWPQAEAMVGYYNAYELSGNDKFLEVALGSWTFIKEQIIDKEKGEWYWSVDKLGNPQTEKEKAGFWKCPYHNGRACMELIRRIDESENQS
jgi:mannobiose 2-epimerase